MTVEFLICGAQKAGTSALDACCRQHPDLQMATRKEVHFFDNDALFNQGSADYSIYHDQFPQWQAGKMRGESTPVYAFWPQAPARIHQYNPAMKLILLLRNPIERAYSHWQMEYRRGHETLSFSDAIHHEEARLAAASADEKRVYSYLARGRYCEQLAELWSLFGRDQVLVLQSDWLKNDQAGVLAKVSEFLGIKPFPALAPQAVNTQAYAEPMAEADRKYLSTLFADEISRLKTQLGWDLSGWR